MATNENIHFDEKDDSIVFIFTVDITSEWLEEDYETENWDTNSKTIKLQKTEITYTLLHRKIQQIYPFVLELAEELDEGECELNIYNTDRKQQITNDETLNEAIAHKNKGINLTIEIADPLTHLIGCYVEYQPKLALIASDRKTGIVLDSGWNTTECTPIYEGKIIK